MGVDDETVTDEVGIDDGDEVVDNVDEAPEIDFVNWKIKTCVFRSGDSKLIDRKKSSNQNKICGKKNKTSVGECVSKF